GGSGAQAGRPSRGRPQAGGGGGGPGRPAAGPPARRGPRAPPTASPRHGNVRRLGQTPIASSGATGTGHNPGRPVAARVLMAACQPALKMQAVAGLVAAALAVAGGGGASGGEGAGRGGGGCW